MNRTALSGMCRLAASIVLAISVSAADVAPNAGPSIAIGGHVQHPQSLTLQNLQTLPPSHVLIRFVTGHGTETGDYTGVLLWTVLGSAAPIDEPGRNARLRHTFLVTGRDGYGVVLSQGELDPDFEGKSVILAYAKDGKPLDAGDGIRLIVPNDRHGGRAVRDVVSIDVH